jgi:aminoglycoside 6'-N-acetyltransferase
VLRPAGAADLPRLTALARDPAVAGTLSTDTAGRLAVTHDPDPGELLVIEHEGAVVGGVRWVRVNRRSRIAEVRTLMLDPAVRGRGLGAQAVRELVSRLFERGMHRVEAEVYGFNAPAQRVFERAGFVREGVRRRAYDRAGDWQDGIYFGLVADDLAG